jgi:hypothetical protein
MGRAVEARRIAEAGLARSPNEVGGQVALALALLDLGQLDDARHRLARLVETASVASRAALPAAADAHAPFEGPLGDVEIETAFDGAESDSEQMLDVNEVAAEAMRREALHDPEEVFSPEAHPDFATATMAGLLERQGDVERAESIRSVLSEDELVSASEPGPPELPAIELGSPSEGVAEPEVEQRVWGASVEEEELAGGLDAAEVLAEPAAALENVRESRAARRAQIVSTLERWLANIQRGQA